MGNISNNMVHCVIYLYVCYLTGRCSHTVCKASLGWFGVLCCNTDLPCVVSQAVCVFVCPYDHIYVISHLCHVCYVLQIDLTIIFCIVTFGWCGVLSCETDRPCVVNQAVWVSVQEVFTEHVCAIGVQWGFNVVEGMTSLVPMEKSCLDIGF